MIELRGYIDEKGNKRFALWLDSLDAAAAAKVTIALTRMEREISQTPKALVQACMNTKSTSAPATAFTLAGMATEL
jgi:hypothetical protein